MAQAQMTLKEFIDQTSDGRIFTVDFVKRTDNTLRTMSCRRGVKKGVKGVGQAYSPAEKNLLTVYDMQKLDPSRESNKGKSVEEMEKGAFRNINLEALVALRMGGKRYDWNHQKGIFVEAV